MQQYASLGNLITINDYDTSNMANSAQKIDRSKNYQSVTELNSSPTLATSVDKKKTKKKTKRARNASQLKAPLIVEADEPISSSRVMLEHKAKIHKSFNQSRKGTYHLYSSMERQYSNLKDLHRDKALLSIQKIAKDPSGMMPSQYASKLQSPQILRPADPLDGRLPEQYQSQLDRAYMENLGAAIEKSAIMGR